MARRRSTLLTAHAAVVLAVVVSAVCGKALARDEPRPFAAAIGDAIESCVDSTTLRFGRDERRALLDAEDTETVGEALMRRYRHRRSDDLAIERVQRGIHISINGLAAGLRNTG